MAGKPEESLLVRAIRYHDEPRMPPEKRLGELEIQNLGRWVELGLPWPSSTGEAAAAKPPDAGAIAALHRPPHRAAPGGSRPRPLGLPPGGRPARPEGPRRGLAALADRRVPPGGDGAARADTRAGGRPADLDPPRHVRPDRTAPPPREVEAFLADDRPAAFERVVDRLLASPHHGEQWGRHWLDLARYADTAGETADYPVPEAYRYRDYVIAAFNQDLPYNDFLTEQIAGDVLAAEGPADRRAARIIATGFLAVARRFGFDPQNYHHLTIDDTIDTLGKTVLGLTHCLRPLPRSQVRPDRQSRTTTPFTASWPAAAYPFPGSEEVKRPRDFVPVGEPGGPAAFAYAMAESAKPADARVQRRGDPTNLGPVVPRRFLAVLGGRDRPPVAKGSGRRELAAALTDPKNPLTARVLVNRVWQHHFGRGLVATPSDFGTRGSAPSHPELLDWLARRFVEDGWSIKTLHRRIMLSRTYRMASRQADGPVPRAEEQARQADPQNVWLAHFNRRRLDAEGLRDAILWLGGDLELGPGGPHPFPPVARWNFTQHAPFQAVYETRAGAST